MCAEIAYLDAMFCGSQRLRSNKPNAVIVRAPSDGKSGKSSSKNARQGLTRNYKWELHSSADVQRSVCILTLKSCLSAAFVLLLMLYLSVTQEFPSKIAIEKQDHDDIYGITIDAAIYALSKPFPLCGLTDCKKPYYWSSVLLHKSPNLDSQTF